MASSIYLGTLQQYHADTLNPVRPRRARYIDLDADGDWGYISPLSIDHNDVRESHTMYNLHDVHYYLPEMLPGHNQHNRLCFYPNATLYVMGHEMPSVPGEYPMFYGEGNMLVNTN